MYWGTSNYWVVKRGTSHWRMGERRGGEQGKKDGEKGGIHTVNTRERSVLRA
jgi:hypothetical protein